ncbi:SRPBCC domain-containing protein [Mucilaginibacter sp. AW1-3]
MTNNTVITKDLANKKLHITREFAAPADKVWTAWTESATLDKWWAPKPWKADTKTMSFTEGGTWLYAMRGPNGEEHWSRVDFKTINPKTGFTYSTTFCDQDGNVNESAPVSHWVLEFIPIVTGTKVEVELTFDKDADLKTLVDMGFEAGFTMGLNNLEELLAAQ